MNLLNDLINLGKTVTGQHQAAPAQSAAHGAPLYASGLNLSGGGLTLNSAPGIQAQPQTPAIPRGAPLNGQGLNLNGQGLSLQSMPGLNGQTPSAPIPLTRMLQFGQHGSPLMVPIHGGRTYEDEALVNGQQGLVPSNSGIAYIQSNNPAVQGQNIYPSQQLIQGGQYNPGNVSTGQGNAYNPQMGAWNNPQNVQGNYWNQ